jgi:ACS family hexuronate transporter-like MFS transporter
MDAANGTDSAPPFPLRRLLRTRTLWGGVLIRLVSDPVWYFCCFWLPGFLRRMGEREGLTNAQTLSMIQWIGGLPFLVGAIGAVLASVWSDGLIRRGAPALRARKTVLAFMVALAPACAFVPFVDGSALPFGWRVGLVVAAFCLIAVLCNSWLHTIPVTLIEQVPVRNGAFVSGCSCGAGAVGTVVFNQFVGTIPESAWTVLFCAMATFHALAALVLWKMVRPETAKEQEDAGTS